MLLFGQYMESEIPVNNLLQAFSVPAYRTAFCACSPTSGRGAMATSQPPALSDNCTTAQRARELKLQPPWQNQLTATQQLLGTSQELIQADGFVWAYQDRQKANPMPRRSLSCSGDG